VKLSALVISFLSPDWPAQHKHKYVASHFIETLMTKRIKTLYLLAAILLAYGYFCRWVGLNFFWDSKSIGWTILYLFAISYLYDNIQSRRSQNKTTIPHKVGIGVFFLLSTYVVVFSIWARFFSDAYEAATNYVENEPSIQKELGKIVRFSIITTGTVQTETTIVGDFGYAIFNLTTEGKNMSKDMKIKLRKNPETSVWDVDSVD